MFKMNNCKETEIYSIENIQIWMKLEKLCMIWMRNSAQDRDLDRVKQVFGIKVEISKIKNAVETFPQSRADKK